MAARATATSDGRRSYGIDRRTIGPALLVFALAVLMSIVLPHIDSATQYHDAVHNGDIVQLADGITLVPTAGWDLATGVVVGQTRSPVGDTAQTKLVHGSVDFYVQAAPFDGTPPALLTRVNQIDTDLHNSRARAAATTHRYAVTTRQGAVGVAKDFVGVARQGSVVAFVFRSRAASTGSQRQSTREGLVIVVAGPTGPISRQRDHIVSMIRSIRAAS
jgi:hypothetical protein